MKARYQLASTAMTIAHQIKDGFDCFGDALRAAWLIAKMADGRRVEFAFAKDTGEYREAVAVACGSLSTLECGFLRFVEWVSPEKTQWRSFRLERLAF